MVTSKFISTSHEFDALPLLHSTSSPATRDHFSLVPTAHSHAILTHASSWNRARPIQKANIVLATALSLAPPNLRLLQQRSITPLGYQCYTVPRHGRAIYPIQSNRSQYGVGHSLQKERKRRNFPLIPDGDGDSNAASRTPENQKLLACNRRPKYRSRRTFPSNKPKEKKHGIRSHDGTFPKLQMLRISQGVEKEDSLSRRTERIPDRPAAGVARETLPRSSSRGARFGAPGHQEPRPSDPVPPPRDSNRPGNRPAEERSQAATSAQSDGSEQRRRLWGAGRARGSRIRPSRRTFACPGGDGGGGGREGDGVGRRGEAGRKAASSTARVGVA